VAQLFEDEKRFADNRHRANFVFVAYPYDPVLPRDDYRKVIKDLEEELPIRLWYFLDEITTAEMMRKIWRAILRSDLAIFDISGGNANVALELGLPVAQNISSITVLKTGAQNPLGSADLGYSERAEYTSANTLKDKLRTILQAKSSACRIIREVSYGLIDNAGGKTREQLEQMVSNVLHVVFKSKKTTKTSAEKLFGDRKLADIALLKLRDLGVLQVEGQKRGAKYIFPDTWVYQDHEVTGV